MNSVATKKDAEKIEKAKAGRFLGVVALSVDLK